MSRQIVIETLFGEFANLFGELQNVHYLQESIEDCKVVNTSLGEAPAFASGHVDLVYMGAMTEDQQELVIDSLRPYRKDIERNIAEGTVFLMTGNAMECMEAYIENEDGSRIEGLGIFPTVHACRQMMDRYNSLILGEYEGIKLVGHKAQFSHSYGDNSDCYFYDVVRGDGLEPGSKKEGLKRNNFFGTYTLGPLLPLNPLFTKHLMGLMGVEDPRLAFEQTAMAAYRARLAEFEDSALRYV